MHFDTKKIKSELTLKPFGQKGWMKNSLKCPFCNGSDKWGILFVGDSGIFNCFKGSCGTKTSLYNYLKEIDRGDLIIRDNSISIEENFVSIYDMMCGECREETADIEEVKMPHRSVRIERSEYLDSRGFLPEHYESFMPSTTSSILEKKLHGYIIFRILQNGTAVSWLARSTFSKEWHDENLRLSKENRAHLALRYRNSEGTEFDRILGGYDDITENTHTVIIVEGLFDKVGCDSKLGLFDGNGIRCVFTFGNKISSNQINLLRRKKSIKNIFLMYDYGTARQCKEYSMKLNRHFNTKVCAIRSDNDPNTMPADEMILCLENAQTPIEFYTGNFD